MKYISECFYTKPLLKLIDNLIDDGFRSYENLSDADKDNIVALCIDALGDEAFECIMASFDTISNLKKYILTGKRDDAYDLAIMMRDAASDYFRDVMECLFIERLNQSESYNSLEHRLFYREKPEIEEMWRKSA